MSKNVTIAGASYTAVPSVDIPATGGGTASFYDVSGTTATASDVATGKLFYAADGTLTTGTASGGGGGGTITQDEDGYLTVSESGTGVSVLQSKSVTPSETAQTVTPDTGSDALASVSVGAISSTYVGSGVTRKAAATITPGTSNQTIAAGTYLEGTQTILGDSDLIPGNIKSGVSLFGLTGTYSGGGGIGTFSLTISCDVPAPANFYIYYMSFADGLEFNTTSSYYGSVETIYVAGQSMVVIATEDPEMSGDWYIDGAGINQQAGDVYHAVVLVEENNAEMAITV